MGAHAKYAPSAIERIEACPGSVKLSANLPDDENEAAKDGSRAHECLEAFVKNGSHQVPMTAKFLAKSYDAEQIKYAKESAILLWKKAKGLKVHSEKKVQLPQVSPHCYGTLDATIVEPFGTLEIVDFKYGKFIPVDVKRNGQLLTYACGEARLHKYNFKDVRLTILQPRATHIDGPIRSWSAPIEFLFKWEKHLREVIRLAESKKPPLSAGPHCFFCKAKKAKICPVYTHEATASVRAGFAQSGESPEKAAEKFDEILDQFWGVTRLRREVKTNSRKCNQWKECNKWQRRKRKTLLSLS